MSADRQQAESGPIACPGGTKTLERVLELDRGEGAAEAGIPDPQYPLARPRTSIREFGVARPATGILVGFGSFVGWFVES